MTISSDPEYQSWLLARKLASKRPHGLSKLTTYKGETHNLKEWATIVGLSYSTIKQRRYYGWTIERILETPAQINQYKERR